MAKPFANLPVGLDPKRARAALMRHKGSLIHAARALHIPTSQLRQAVRADPTLIAAALEAHERALDQAEDIIREGLDSDDFKTRLASAAHLMRFSPAARRRGYG
jgi:aryl carrier-like protein